LEDLHIEFEASIISELATEFEVHSAQLLKRNILSIFNCPTYFSNEKGENI